MAVGWSRATAPHRSRSSWNATGAGADGDGTHQLRATSLELSLNFPTHTQRNLITHLFSVHPLHVRTENLASISDLASTLEE